MTEKQIEKIMEDIASINSKLDPIYETYQVWLTIGRWGKTFIWLTGGVLGLIVAWRQIFRK